MRYPMFLLYYCCFLSFASAQVKQDTIALFGGYKGIYKEGRYAILSPDGRQVTDYLFPNYCFPLPDGSIAVPRQSRNGIVNYEEVYYPAHLFNRKGKLLNQQPIQIYALNSDWLWYAQMEGKSGLLHRDGRFIPMKDNVRPSWDQKIPDILLTYEAHNINKSNWLDNASGLLGGWLDITTLESMPAQFQAVWRLGNRKVIAVSNDTSFLYEGLNLLKYLPFRTTFGHTTGIGFYYQKNRIGFIDTLLIPITPAIYSDFTTWNESSFSPWITPFAAKKEGQYGILSPTGEVLLPFEYDSIRLDKNNGIAKVYKGAKTGFVTQRGYWVSHMANRSSEGKGDVFGLMKESRFVQYWTTYYPKDTMMHHQENLLKLQYIGGGCCLARKGNRLGLWDIKQKKLLIPDIYDSIKTNYPNLLIWQNGKVGVVSYTGKIVLPPVYNKIDLWYSKYIVALRDSLYGMWDTTGLMVLRPEYQQFQDCGYYFIRAKKDGHYGLFNRKLELILPFEYDEINCEFNSFTCKKDGIVTRWTIQKDQLKQAEILPVNKYGKTEHAGCLSEWFVICYGRLFRERGKIGLLNATTWREVFPARYDQLIVVLRPDVFAVGRRGKKIELLLNYKGKVGDTWHGDTIEDAYFNYPVIRFKKDGVLYVYDLLDGEIKKSD